MRNSLLKHKDKHTYIAEVAKLSSDGYGNKTCCLTNVTNQDGDIEDHIWVKTQTALQKKLFAKYMGRKIKFRAKTIEYMHKDGTKDYTLKIDTIIGEI